MIRSEGARKVLHSVSWLFLERVVRLGMVLLTGIYVARYLGEVLFGQMNYATGFVGLFFALGQAGVDDILVRDLVRYPEKKNELLGTGAVIKMGGSILLVLLASLGSVLKGMDHLTVLLVVIAASAELLRPFSVIDGWFMSQMKTRATVKVQMVQVLISSVAKFLLIAAIAFDYITPQQALVPFAWMYALENLIVAIGYLIAFNNDGGHWREWRSTRSMASHLLNESWPMLIYGMALYVAARIDQVMIKDLLTRTRGETAAFAEVGQYSVALRMVEALGFVPTIFQKSLNPAITKAKAQSHEQYQDRLLNLYRLQFMLFLAMAVPLFFIAQPLIVWFFGEQYAPAGYLLSLFAIRLFFTNMGTAKGSFIVNESLFKYSLITAVIGAAVNIGINYLLIPQYASIGAIWATIISFTVHIFLLDLFVPRMRANLALMMKGMFTFWKFHRAS